MNPNQDPGLNHGQGGDPEHINKVRESFMEKFKNIIGHQQKTEYHVGEFSFPERSEDVSESAAEDEVANNYQALDQEGNYGAPVEDEKYNGINGELPAHDEDDVKALTNTHMTGDQLIDAIDESKEREGHT